MLEDSHGAEKRVDFFGGQHNGKFDWRFGVGYVIDALRHVQYMGVEELRRSHEGVHRLGREELDVQQVETESTNGVLFSFSRPTQSLMLRCNSVTGQTSRRSIMAGPQQV